MAILIIRQEDLQQFNTEVLEDFKDLFHAKTNEHELSLRPSGVKKMLTISYSRVGGTLCYNHGDVGSCLQTLNI